MKLHIIILLLFILLTLLLTYPVVLNMHKAVQEAGDSLFNAWTIFWDIKAILRNPLDIFHTNIFYPYRYTLAYSEHLIGIAILALPLYVFTQNPLFIYNFMLLLSFVLSGWGVYLLTYHLTKDRLAGIVSGIIFSFCPFRFSQFGHLHVLTSQWIPFALLILHKISEADSKQRWRLEFWFGFFFFLQFISSGHNGLYLALTVGLFMLYFRIFPWRILLIVGLLIFPFYYPYTYLAREFGFIRPLYEFKLYSPQLSSYLAVPRENWLYGKYLSRFCRPEAVMFPGIVALVLTFWKKTPRIKMKASVINYLILFDLLVILFIAVTGGIDLHRSILGIKLKVTDFSKPVYILLFLLALRIKFKCVAKKVVVSYGTVQFYGILAMLTFLLSFGPKIRVMDRDVVWGPYSLLYNYVPGFKGLRVSGRIYTVFILALSVLAGFGVKRIKGRIRYIIPFLVLAECFYMPIQLRCRIGTEPSPAYKWLAGKPDDSVVIELPMPYWYDMFWHEIQYQYWSLFHRKRLVNGYSGYSPPSYWPIAELMQDFPNEDAVEILRYIGVKYILIHGERILEDTDDYKLVFKDRNDCIYELVNGKTSLPPLYCKGPALHVVSISANYNQSDIYKAIDGNPDTRWHSGKNQEPGMFIEVDLGGIKKIKGISMYLGEHPTDYPRGIEVYLDNRKIVLKYVYADYVKRILNDPNNNRRFVLNFPVSEGRFIKIIQTGSHPVFYWSIYELEIEEAV